MKIIKLGHCCLVIQVKELKILTDPGMYSSTQNFIRDLDVVLITHEHGDHLHMESVQAILTNNPNVRIITNKAVGKLLAKEGIKFEVLEDAQTLKIGEVLLEGLGTKHAEIFEEFGQVLNTGFFIDNQLFYPGDALYNPKRPVDVLAFPTAGSWANTKESINYVFEIKPKKCFPVHDGNFKSSAFLYSTYSQIIPKEGIEVITPELGQEFGV